MTLIRFCTSSTPATASSTAAAPASPFSSARAASVGHPPPCPRKRPLRAIEERNHPAPVAPPRRDAAAQEAPGRPGRRPARRRDRQQGGAHHHQPDHQQPADERVVGATPHAVLLHAISLHAAAPCRAAARAAFSLSLGPGGKNRQSSLDWQPHRLGALGGLRAAIGPGPLFSYAR